MSKSKGNCGRIPQAPANQRGSHLPPKDGANCHTWDRSKDVSRAHWSPPARLPPPPPPLPLPLVVSGNLSLLGYNTDSYHSKEEFKLTWLTASGVRSMVGWLQNRSIMAEAMAEPSCSVQGGQEAEQGTVPEQNRPQYPRPRPWDTPRHTLNPRKLTYGDQWSH